MAGFALLSAICKLHTVVRFKPYKAEESGKATGFVLFAATLPRKERTDCSLHQQALALCSAPGRKHRQINQVKSGRVVEGDGQGRCLSSLVYACSGFC